MENSFKYRFIAFTLVGVFAVFNIGLPVVLHYCEMMKSTTTSTCGMCGTESTKDHQVQYNSVKSACCKTIFTPERNKNEFLQQNKIDSKEQQNLLILNLSIPFNNSEYKSISYVQNFHSPPPFIEDIPIFTSSLLI